MFHFIMFFFVSTDALYLNTPITIFYSLHVEYVKSNTRKKCTHQKQEKNGFAITHPSTQHYLVFHFIFFSILLSLALFLSFHVTKIIHFFMYAKRVCRWGLFVFPLFISICAAQKNVRLFSVAIFMFIKASHCQLLCCFFYGCTINFVFGWYTCA